MPHEYLKADLFTAPGKMFAHGCNAYGIMGGGIAKYVRDTFPDVYTVYRETYIETGVLSPGSIIPAYMNEYDGDDRIMLNLITQIQPGPDARVELLQESLQRAVDYCAKIGEQHLSIPAIGCGIGGLDLLDLEQVLYNLDTEVMVHVFVP